MNRDMWVTVFNRRHALLWGIHGVALHCTSVVALEIGLGLKTTFKGLSLVSAAVLLGLVSASDKKDIKTTAGKYH